MPAGAVVHEALPEQISEFKSKFWRSAPLFLDEEKAMFRAVGDGNVRRADLVFALTERRAFESAAGWASA